MVVLANVWVGFGTEQQLQRCAVVVVHSPVQRSPAGAGLLCIDISTAGHKLRNLELPPTFCSSLEQRLRLPLQLQAKNKQDPTEHSCHPRVHAHAQA